MDPGGKLSPGSFGTTLSAAVRLAASSVRSTSVGISQIARALTGKPINVTRGLAFRATASLARIMDKARIYQFRVPLKHLPKAGGRYSILPKFDGRRKFTSSQIEKRELLLAFESGAASRIQSRVLRQVAREV